MSHSKIIFKKDCLRLKGIVWTWLCFLLFQTVLNMIGIRWIAGNLHLYPVYPLIAETMKILQGLFVFVLILLLVLEDALTGSRAFWMTRPISRKELLIAKVEFILIFIVLPLCISEMIVLKTQAFSFSQILWTVPEIILENLVFLLPALFYALFAYRFSYFVIVLGLLLISTLFFRNAHPLDTSTTNMASQIKVITDIDQAIIVDYPRFRERDERRKSIRAKQTVAGLKAGQFAVLSQADDVDMNYPDGSRLVMASYPAAVLEAQSFTQTKFMNPLQSALGEYRLLNPFREDFTGTEIFNLREEQFNQFKGMVGEYHAKAKYDIYQYEPHLFVPLKSGQSVNTDNEQLVIIDVLKRPDGITVLLDEKQIHVFLKGNKFLSSVDETLDNFRRIYVLRNPKQKQAFVMEPTIGIRAYWPYSQRLTHAIRRIDFLYINDRNDKLPLIDDRWLADAELIRMDVQKLGSQEKNIVYKNFYIPSRSTKMSKRNAL